MPLQFSLQQAPMRLGLAEGVDPHQVPFGTLTTAENVCWDRSGRIQKRAGTTLLTNSIVGGGTVSTVKRLIVRGTELALTDGNTLYSYTSSGWISRGRHPEKGVDWYTSIDTVQGVQSCDMVYLTNGQVVEAWVVGDPGGGTTTGTLYYQIRDVASKTIVTAATQVATNVYRGFRLVFTGTTWLIIFADSSGNLKSYNASATTTLKTDVMTTSDMNNIDAISLGTDFVVVYPTSALNVIRQVRYSIANTPVQAANVTINGETTSWIAIAGAVGEHIYVVWNDRTAGASRLRMAQADASTLASTVAPFTIATATFFGWGAFTVARETATSCLLIYSDITLGWSKSVSVDTSGVVTAGSYTPFLTPISRPWSSGGRFYCVFASSFYALTLIATPVATSDTFIADVTRESTDAFREVAKIDALTGGAYPFGFITQPVTLSSSETAIAVGFQSSVNTQRGGMRQGVRFVHITTSPSQPADMWRNVQVGQEAYMAAGVLTSYDGVEALGYGYPHGPYIDTQSTVLAAGGSIVAGDYLYQVTAERRSAVGVLHRSPVSLSYKMSPSAGNLKVTVAILPASFGHSSKNPGQFPVYRTVRAGTIPQRIAFEPSYMTFLDSGLTPPTTITDTDADATVGPGGSYTLASRPAIYTAGGELEDTQPPSCLTLTTFQNRMWMVAGDGRTVWFSKDATANPGTAPGFHPNMSIAFDRTVTALSAMDDKLIVFAADMFWYLVGSGPSANGLGATYDTGVVQTDVGCSNPRSVVSTPIGIIFQAASGLHLLSRKLEVSWIGKPIKDQLANYPNITSAVLVSAKNEIRWTANNAGGSLGIVLVYNYVEDQWTTFKYTSSGVYGTPIADACMWNGVYTYATNQGLVHTESTSSYLDDGAFWVPITLETAWVSASGPLAYQSVRTFALEGISNSNHDLTLSVAFDNETSYVQTATFAAGSPVTSIGPLESCEISVGTRRKCQSIRFKIQDASPTNPGSYPAGTGQGPSFDMLGLEIGVMNRFVPKPATKTG